MNMFSIHPALFPELERKLPDFLAKAHDNPKAEFLMPTIADELIREKRYAASAGNIRKVVWRNL